MQFEGPISLGELYHKIQPGHWDIPLSVAEPFTGIEDDCELKEQLRWSMTSGTTNS